MTFFHFRYRQRLGLLASSSLEPRETDWVREHVAMCSACQAELAELSRLTTTLREDAAIDRPLPISSEALRTRVLARVRSSQAAPARARGLSLSPAMAALGLAGTRPGGGSARHAIPGPGERGLAGPCPASGLRGHRAQRRRVLRAPGEDALPRERRPLPRRGPGHPDSGAGRRGLSGLAEGQRGRRPRRRRRAAPS